MSYELVLKRTIPFFRLLYTLAYNKYGWAVERGVVLDVGHIIFLRTTCQVSSLHIPGTVHTTPTYRVALRGLLTH